MPLLAINLIIGFIYLMLVSKLLWHTDLNLLAGISKQRLLTFFWVKVFWCFLFYLVHLLFNSGGDTIDFFQASDQVYRSLYRDPMDYLRLVFLPNHYYVSESLYHYNYAINRYGDESTFFLIRLNALFRLFSFGSYWAQMVLFSFVTLPGVLLLYRLFTQHLALGNRWSIIILLYLPATAFWIHGVHKEALLISAMGLLFSLLQHSKRYLLLSVIGFLVIGIIRSHYLLLLMPLLLSSWLHQKKQLNTLLTYTASLMLVILSITTYCTIIEINPITYVFQHRSEYAGLDHTVIQASDFWKWFYTSIGVVMISPLQHISLHQSYSNWAFAALTLSFIILMIYPLFLYSFHQSAVHLIFIVTALIEFVIIGLIVIQDGAIARYRAPMLVLFLAGYMGMFVKKTKKFNN